MRIVFFASDIFACEPLEALVDSSHRVLAVVGRPDRPAGRGRSSSATPAVQAARARGLEVWQPESLSVDAVGPLLEGLEWDAGVVVAYGGLVPRWLLDVPRFGFVNLHPSLLPRYRGAAPVARAIMGGASITGVTTIKMNEKLDEGDILMHREIPIEDEDTEGVLSDRLSHAGARLLLESLSLLEDGSIEAVPQEDDKATCAPPLDPGEAEIDWSGSAEDIHRLIRALNPQPGAYTWFRGRRVKVWSGHVTEVPQEDEPGTIMNLGKEGFIVNTGTTGLQVSVLQPEGKNRMTASEFSRGQRLLIAESFTRGGEARGRHAR
jgi:methionyl-tRNA formyltransferase